MARSEKKSSLGPDIPQISAALEPYRLMHPQCKIKSYRENWASVRVRIIDPDFRGLDRAERHDLIWKFLEASSEELLSEIAILLLLTPEEAKTSFANVDFENPIPSRL